jgi:hypothetical protein
MHIVSTLEYGHDMEKGTWAAVGIAHKQPHRGAMSYMLKTFIGTSTKTNYNDQAAQKNITYT